ncbi:MAG: nucleotidyl transferase AbiEii/AbiGii toxin family protein [Telmatospirillum sp.]|nr:nucleotidyl transferase AbiEii/AbiGii toxin family protein [Telmatospirillum sp.]
MFTPILGILPEPQRCLWSSLSGLPFHFVLYGGTAIALRLGHRQSVDFDFFSDVVLDDAGKQSILDLFDVDGVLQNGPDTLVFIARAGGRPVKLSFFGGLKTGCVASPEITDDGVMRVASLDDLFAHKLKAIHDRAEGRDYQDIAVMLMNGQSLARGLAAREALFGSSVPAMLTLKALTYFSDINEPERLTTVLKQAIIAAVRTLPETWDAVSVLSHALACDCAR